MFVCAHNYDSLDFNQRCLFRERALKQQALTITVNLQCPESSTFGVQSKTKRERETNVRLGKHLQSVVQKKRTHKHTCAYL